MLTRGLLIISQRNNRDKQHNMSSNPPNIYASVCCLMGLPASGKSTFARTIYQQHSSQCASKKCIDDCKNDDIDAPGIGRFDKILVVDYDSITQQELTLCQTKDESSNDEATAVDDSQSTSQKFDSNDLEAWRKSRDRALATLKDALITHFTDQSCNNRPCSLFILMDDNFHLRSMRRDVYRTCQAILATYHTAQIGFSTVHFTTPLGVCLERNKMRSGKACIPIDVIQRMNDVLEPPDVSKPYASFEQFHVSVDNSDESMNGSKILSEIDHCIQQSLQTPIPAKNELSKEDLAQLEQQRRVQREENRKCQIQQTDLLLRKLVGAVGRVEKKKSREANELRKSIMEKIRNDDDIVDMSEDSVIEDFACSIIGIEVNSKWCEVESPLVQSIKDTLESLEKMKLSNHNE